MHEQDVEAVRKAIAAMGEAFNAKNPGALMALHAPDVILTDPGLPDQTFETLAKSYGELNKMKPGVTVTTSPTIEEILLWGDLAVVRIIWTTQTAEKRSATQVHPVHEGAAGLAPRKRREVEVCPVG